MNKSMEQPVSHVPHPETKHQPSSGELLSAAHFLTMNAYSFAVMHEEGGGAILAPLAEEFLDKFSRVARPQMPASRIQERFSPQADLADIFGAIDIELTAWARGGVVESQVAPLGDYVRWLIEAHTEDLMDSFDDETRLVVERRLALARARIGYDAE